MLEAVYHIAQLLDLENPIERGELAKVLLGIQIGRSEQAQMHERWIEAGQADPTEPGAQEWPSKHRALLTLAGLNPDHPDGWGILITDAEAMKRAAEARAEAERKHREAFEAAIGRWFAAGIAAHGTDVDLTMVAPFHGATIGYYDEVDAWMVTPVGRASIEPEAVDQVMGMLRIAEAKGLGSFNPARTRYFVVVGANT